MQCELKQNIFFTIKNEWLSSISKAKVLPNKWRSQSLLSQGMMRKGTSRGPAAVYYDYFVSCNSSNVQIGRFSAPPSKTIGKRFHLHSFFDNASPCSSERASTLTVLCFLASCRRLAARSLRSNGLQCDGPNIGGETL